MPIEIMIDFESLSLKENAVLLSLGACVFDPATGKIGAQFYAAIDPRTQPGRDISASTVLWWLEQDTAARAKITDAVKATDILEAGFGDEDSQEAQDEAHENAAHSIQSVARAFIVFLETLGDPDVVCWSNGAVDHVWLNSMVEYSGYKNPIKFWLQRDYRTLKGLFPNVKAEVYGVAHNALDDAIKQAKHACLLLQHIAEVHTDAGVSYPPYEPTELDIGVAAESKAEDA